MKKVIKSTRNADLFVVNGFIFRIKRIGNNFISWRCRVRGCLAIGKSSLDYIVNTESFAVSGSHNHESEYNVISKKELANSVKKIIDNSNSSVRTIISQSLRGATREKIVNSGRIETLYRNAREYRNKTLNPKPYAFPELKLSDKLAKTHLDSRFYQFGIGNFRNLIPNGNILLFYSDAMIENIRHEKFWCVDGTFKVVPRPFIQLLTISFLKEAHVFPVFFAVLKNKKEETYVEMFEIISDLCGIFNPEIIKADFELSLLNALSRSFPSARISACMFHLGQCLQRKLKSEKIFNLYKTNISVKRYVKALSALAFIDITRIEENFLILRTRSDFPAVLSVVYDYFYDYFLCPGSMFSVNLWHSYRSVELNFPKTNNAIEAWHNVFNSTFGTSKFSLILLISKLKDEEEVIRQKLVRQLNGDSIPRKLKYLNMETNLRIFLSGSSEKSGFEFISSLVDLLFY